MFLLKNMLEDHPSCMNKQTGAVKQYASVLFPAPELIGLLMDLNVPKGGFQHVSEFTSRRGATYTATMGLPFPRPLPSGDRFTNTWKALAKPLELQPPVSVPDPPTSGCSWPLQSRARYIESRPSPVDTVERMLYRSCTGVQLVALAAPDGEEARALFFAWEEIGPLLACAPEDGEWQAVVAMWDILRDLYVETPPRSDLRAEEVARAYRLHFSKPLANLITGGRNHGWGRIGCQCVSIRAATPFRSVHRMTTRPAVGEC